MSRQRKFIGFIAITIAMFMGMLDSTIINVALPDITAYFHSNLKDTSWISTIYVMGLAVFMITASKLADQFGRKKVMLVGLFLFGLSSALCGFSNSLMMLIALRLIQGIGGAIITPIVVPMGIEIFGKEKMRTVAGAVGAVTALAAAGGPPIGGLILKYIDWKGIFFVNVPFAVISILLTALFIGESYDKTVSKSIDWIGMFLITSTLFLLTFSLLKGNDYGWGSALIVSMFIGSAISLVLFLFAEAKVKAPMVELHLFRESTFTASCICYLITGFGIASPILVFSYFLQNALGYDALKAGLIIMAVSLTVIISMPLGNVIAGRVGAKPVNFLGVLFLGIGDFLLSRLQIDTSRIIMVADMIVCGFGVGFASQSIISAIRYLPREKSGIGSGVVNAARQIGVCIGIALLVSILDANVANAKNEIRNSADTSIRQSGIVGSVKTVMVKDIDSSFSDNDDSSNTQQQDLQTKLQNDIESAINSVSNAPSPTDSTLAKLYNGAASLRDGAGKATDGQNTLGTGIKSLSTGLDTLGSGSKALTSGLETLNSGLSKAFSGAQTLDTDGGKGLGALSSGIGQLNTGAQSMLKQFAPGSASNPTVYDGITGVAGGAQGLSFNVNTYVSAVDNTLFLMIKNDPASAQLLATYKSSLAKTEAAYASATDATTKAQDEQQLKALGNLVTLYTAGTDVSVTNEQQFETELLSLARQNNTEQSVVSSGGDLEAGAAQLSGAARSVASQFADGGTFKSGMVRLANGVTELAENSGKLTALQTGIEKLTSALSQLNSGSSKLLSGSRSLQNGLSSAEIGNAQMLSGSSELAGADAKIKDGAAQIVSGVGLAGQQGEIETIVNKVKTDKDKKIAGAFDNTFLIAAIILVLASISGLFTDKKTDNEI